LWWGRIGKIVQLIAALTILAEIVGPERLRTFGKSLRAQFGVRLLKHVLKEWLRDKDTEPIMYASGCFLTLVGVVIWDFYFMYTGWKDISSYSFLRIVVCLIALSIIGVVVIGTPIMYAIEFLSVLLAVLVAAIDVLLITPVAWVLEQPYADKVIKIASVLLLLVGFHFELLAS
jgi:hypothetical protein